jgi:hypothetical protein
MGVQEVSLQTRVSVAAAQFADPRWRLNNLYYITDKKGHRVQFRMNTSQEELFNTMWFMNVILKHRQRGFTTFIQLFMLDACLFNSNVRAGTVAHTLIDAQAIFRDKVKYPYDNLPDVLKAAIPQTTDSRAELMLANNSSLRIGTSLRSGTMNYLHISEYGKLCAKYPEKAREVRTGALNTVQAGQIVFIESTGEGQEGHYFELCDMARSKARTKATLTPLDFKFFFFSWLADPDCEMPADEVVVPAEYERYFEKLKKNGIIVRPEQKAWYVKKAEVQKGDMLREYPSTPDEAFEASIEGAYYANEMAVAELAGRIGLFPAIPGVPVHTAWDIGYGDYTTIWFFQRIGSTIRIVAYFQASGEGLPFYLKEMVRLAKENIWKWGSHFWPHDGKVHEWGSALSRIEQANDNKILKIFPIIVPRMAIDDGINAARAILPMCEFNQGPCAEGLKAMRSYRKEWDEERAVWRDRPLHNWASHGADGFRTLAGRWQEIDPAPTPEDVKGDGYASRKTDREAEYSVNVL